MTDPPKSGLTDEAIEQIKEGIRILKEDGFHFHKTYDKYVNKRDKAKTPVDPKTPVEPPKEGDVPPPKTDPNEPADTKRRGVWWGDAKDE